MNGSYTYLDHWKALRRTGSSRWIFRVFVAVNTILVLIRGVGIYSADIKAVIDWLSWEWFLGILAFTLAVLLLVVFYATQKMMNSRINSIGQRSYTSRKPTTTLYVI